MKADTIQAPNENKPEALTRALMLTCSRPNDLVLVPFAGSGTECAMLLKKKIANS